MLSLKLWNNKWNYSLLMRTSFSSGQSRKVFENRFLYQSLIFFINCTIVSYFYFKYIFSGLIMIYNYKCYITFLTENILYSQMYSQFETILISYKEMVLKSIVNHLYFEGSFNMLYNARKYFFPYIYCWINENAFKGFYIINENIFIKARFHISYLCNSLITLNY